jgi:hypothetical protein
VLHLIKALPKTQTCFLATKEIQIHRHHIAKGENLLHPQFMRVASQQILPEVIIPMVHTKGHRADFTMQTAHPHKESEDASECHRTPRL